MFLSYSAFSTYENIFAMCFPAREQVSLHREAFAIWIIIVFWFVHSWKRDEDDSNRYIILMHT